ncbi:MAG: lytic murein transglycosylase [Rhodospirillaceae bacterium]|jgi:membrane-bound lytic murein transglycosylase B|nr:lytic murein transglycosylase [Rhodospirillaceae bacterium]
MKPLYLPATLRRGLPMAFIAASVLLAPPAPAQTLETRFATWLDEVRTEARGRGISEKVIQSALKDIKPVARIIKRDRNQAEFKLTLPIYMKRVVTKRNIKRGRDLAVKHKDLLARVAKKYGVQPRVILAIWGIETRFGAVKANVPVIPSVATLAFDRRRSKYFRSQLFATLLMIDRGYIELENLLGSWAGAMGQPQFMPSSYLAYAQDFDGDGRRDIWKNTGDVFASIANYLAKHGWRDHLTWGRAVRLPEGGLDKAGPLKRRAAPGCRARTSQPKRLSEWQALGVRRSDGSNLPTRDLKAFLVKPEGVGQKEAFLVYGNYAAIMSYNCAHLYAVTVGILSDRIGYRS